jgi:hypothetical protein
MQEIGKKLSSSNPVCKNHEAGNPVKDWENQNYRNTDASAGTGDGAHSEPQKVEVL